MSVSGKPWRKWDLERWFYTDPLLSKTDRAVARQILAQMNNQFQPVEVSLKSQAFIGGRVACWRETVNRSLRKLVTLGYFAKTLITVQRKTKQGIKGVTRTLVTLGSVTEPLVAVSRKRSSTRGVISDHSPRPPLATRGTVGNEAVAKSTDRRGSRPETELESKRKALAAWPRLAGSKPIDPEQLPSAVPASDVSVGIHDPAAYRKYLDQLEAVFAAKSRRRARD